MQDTSPIKARYIGLIASAIFAYAALWWTLYSTINAYNSLPERMVVLRPRPCDLWPDVLQPLAVIPYTVGAAVIMGMQVWVCLFRNRCLHLLVSTTTGTAIGFTVFLLWPLGMIRPDAGNAGVLSDALNQVFAVDNPANCFPSFHTFFAVSGAAYVWWSDLRRSLRLLAVVLCLGVLYATIATGQHYLIDVPAGAGLAWFSLWFASRWGRCDPHCADPKQG